MAKGISFFSELLRRRVVRVVLGYIAVIWLLSQGFSFLSNYLRIASMDEQETNPPPALVNCKNCRTEINGLIFCPTCGQKGDTHVLTLRELLRKVADGLLDFDSRLWRTLIPLAVSPGKLTNAYLFGRRMYYLPPFRLYLILSVLFFLMPNTDLDFNADIEENITSINEELNNEV